MLVCRGVPVGRMRRVEQRREVREIADLHEDDRVIRLAAENLAQQCCGLGRIRTALEAMRVAEFPTVLGLSQRQELAGIVGKPGVREPNRDAWPAVEGVHSAHERPGHFRGLRYQGKFTIGL